MNLLDPQNFYIYTCLQIRDVFVNCLRLNSWFMSKRVKKKCAETTEIIVYLRCKHLSSCFLLSPSLSYSFSKCIPLFLIVLKYPFSCHFNF